MSRTLRPATLRVLGFLVLWVVVTGGYPTELAAARTVATLAASWASLHLPTPGTSRVRPAALARLTLHCLRQSVAAGG